MRRSVQVAPAAENDLDRLAQKYGVQILRDLRDASKQNFDDHELKGQLDGWRAFSIGPQNKGEAPRTVYYYLDRIQVLIVAAGEHDEAYRRAISRRKRRGGWGSGIISGAR